MGVEAARLPGEKLSLVDRQDLILEVQGMLDRGIVSPTVIANTLGVDRKTAVKYREAAVEISQNDPSHKREAVRNVQLRQIDYQIQQVSSKLEDLAAASERGEQTNLQHIVALHNALRGYFESRAKITGLNWETNVNVDIGKRINFISSCGLSSKECRDQHKSNNLDAMNVIDVPTVEPL